MDFKRDGQRLFLMTKNQLVAEATFPVVDDQTWAVEHLWVSDQLDKPAVANEMLTVIESAAATENIYLLPLDPFARHHLHTRLTGQ